MVEKNRESFGEQYSLSSTKESLRDGQTDTSPQLCWHTANVQEDADIEITVAKAL